jgi:hypothetical protein
LGFSQWQKLEFILLGYYKLWPLRQLSTFWNNLLPPSSGSKTIRLQYLITFAPNINSRLNYTRPCAGQVQFHSWQRKQFFLCAIKNKRAFLFRTKEEEHENCNFLHKMPRFI